MGVFWAHLGGKMRYFAERFFFEKLQYMEILEKMEPTRGVEPPTS